MRDMTAYDRRFETHKDAMRAFIAAIAQEFGTDVDAAISDESGFGTIITRHDGTLLDVSLTIWDSGEADDGIYGKHGNFMLSAVEEGGRILISIAPSNYSADVWVDYDGEEADNEWHYRMDTFSRSVSDVIATIREWYERES
jgi:hypothetical protein